MQKAKIKQPHSTEPIVVVFGSERLASQWATRNARNPRNIMLATNGGAILQGRTQVTTVRFPEEWWQPITHPCEARVREVEAALKHIKQTGGEVIEVLETA